MQFSPDIEMCIRDKNKLRTLAEPRKTEVRLFLQDFRKSWHIWRATLGFKDSLAWMIKRYGVTKGLGEVNALCRALHLTEVAP